MSATNIECQPSYNTLNLPRICQRIVNQLLGRQLPADLSSSGLKLILPSFSVHCLCVAGI